MLSEDNPAIYLRKSSKEPIYPYLGYPKITCIIATVKTGKTTHSKAYRNLLKHLREARIKANLTQADVAMALKKPQSLISKIESGERRMDLIELKRFADLYKVPVTQFLRDLS